MANEVIGAVGVNFDQHRIAAGGVGNNIVDIALDGRRRDAMFDIIGMLFFAAAVGFANRTLHASRHPVGIQDNAAFDVTCGATNGLNERRFAAQETFFVRIQNRDEAALGNIQTLTQQVDADKHVIHAAP